MPRGDTGGGDEGGDLLDTLGGRTAESERISSDRIDSAVTLLPPGLAGVS